MSIYTKRCRHCGGELFMDPFDGGYYCAACGYSEDQDGNPKKIQSSNQKTVSAPKPSNVNYVVKTFYNKYLNNNKMVTAEEQLQQYLNQNNVDPNHIVSIDSSYIAQYQAFYFTLVYFV